jgi:predicted MFS family arabinose efflux permease
MPEVTQRRPDSDDIAALGGGLSRGLVLLLALACGAAAANVYYAQPLLHTLAGAFGVSDGTAGLLITVTQLGYVVGLALVVPLGDLHERRGLITFTMLVTAAGMVVAATAPALAVFGAALAVVGVSSVVAQVIVPMSSSLSADHERGSVVGTVMSGLLIGILLARTISGVLAAALGWRVVFWFAAAAMVRWPPPCVAPCPASRAPPTSPTPASCAPSPVSSAPSRCCASACWWAPWTSAASARCGRRWPSCSPERRITTATR